MSQEVLKQIKKEKIVAIVRGVSKTDIIPLAEALLAGGIRCMEVTFDRNAAEQQQNTLEAIRGLSETFGNEICIGAGTVTSVQHVVLAAEAGAEYLISPNTDEEVICLTKALGKISIPGAMTPSEIMNAWNAGADIVKIFPANDLGLAYFKSIRAPLGDIPLMATGGIDTENLADYLGAGSVAAGVGGNLVNKAWIRAGEFSRITETAKAFQAVVQRFS